MNYTAANAKMWARLGQRAVLGIALHDIAKRDSKLVVSSADLFRNTGLDRFAGEFPDRLINVGIAENNLIGVSCGLAKEGFNVFAFSFATFATARCLEFIRVNMAYGGIPLKLVGIGAGFAFNTSGVTHCMQEDIGIIRALPNITILSPADCMETVKAVEAAAEYDKPVYIRLGGIANTPVVYSGEYDYKIGKAVTLREGKDIAIIATGTMVHSSLQAAEQLEADGYSCRVIDMHTIKPLDTNAIDECLSAKLIVTVEEHSKIGGLGGACAEYLANIANKPKQLIIGIADKYYHAGSYEFMLRQAGLTIDNIYSNIKEILQ
jgi:transketolase